MEEAQEVRFSRCSKKESELVQDAGGGAMGEEAGISVAEIKGGDLKGQGMGVKKASGSASHSCREQLAREEGDWTKKLSFGRKKKFIKEEAQCWEEEITRSIHTD